MCFNLRSFAHMHPEFVDKLIFCNIPHPRLVLAPTTHLIWTPQHYRQFALSLGKEIPNIFFKFIPIKWDPSESILSGFECIDNMNYTAIYWVSCFTNSQKVKNNYALSFHQVKLCNCTVNSINIASVTLDYTRPTLNSLRLWKLVNTSSGLIYL